MRILAIETSCDETGLALIETEGRNRIKVLANLLSSQIEIHRPYGGVVPNLAKREHIKNLTILFRQIFENPKFSVRPTGGQTPNTKKIQNSKFKIQDVDLIAVTQGPGLAPCLWAGINFAADLAKKFKKPLIGINHLKGHIYSAFLRESRIENSKFKIQNSDFPILSLIVSGGHTQLVFSKKINHYQIIGETIDDAAGEAFDKVARLLGLKYPGGPEIAKLAEKGNPLKFALPRPMINNDDFNFSFSGLKTSVLYLVKGLHPPKTPLKLTKKNLADLCASFQQAVIEVLVTKTLKAAKKFKPKTLILGGGVAANKLLRKKLKEVVSKGLSHVTCHMSHVALTGDNALMIALAARAEIKILKPVNPVKMEAKPNWKLDEK